MSDYESDADRSDAPEMRDVQAKAAVMADEIVQLDAHCRAHGLGGLAQCLALLISQASGVPKWVPAVVPVPEPRSRES